MPRAQANGIELEYDTFGSPDDPAMLLIMGFSVQMIHWDERLCRLLAERGYHVIRFDNRDVGLSTKIDHGPPPDLAAAMAGDTSSAPYTLDDMADDAAGLLDALGIESAHVVGASMGGMIAQLLAIRHPERVITLCSIMSTTGDPAVGQPDAEAMAALLSPPPSTPEEAEERGVAVYRVIGSKTNPADEVTVRERARRAFERAAYPPGVVRQLVAILASPDRTTALADVRVPTLVLHGDEDPLVTPSGGRATAAAIPGAAYVEVQGMAHDLPEPLWPAIVAEIVKNAERGEG